MRAWQRATERSSPIEQRPISWTTIVYAGSGMAIGAALGLLFGVMLLDNVIAGPLVGAVPGAVFSVIYEILRSRERKD
jgi:uncharacterized membrane protein